jgi:hypothetical protein
MEILETVSQGLFRVGLGGRISSFTCHTAPKVLLDDHDMSEDLEFRLH